MHTSECIPITKTHAYVNPSEHIKQLNARCSPGMYEYLYLFTSIFFPWNVHKQMMTICRQIFCGHKPPRNINRDNVTKDENNCNFITFHSLFSFFSFLVSWSSKQKGFPVMFERLNHSSLPRCKKESTCREFTWASLTSQMFDPP